MRTLKRFAAILFTAVFMLGVFHSAAYAQLDLNRWDGVQMYTVLEDGSESNSSVECIILKTIHDNEVNQLHMLFMFEVKSFNDDTNTGVRMSFEDLGTVELHSDSTAEYDDEIFFAEIDNILSDARSKAVYIEVTLGIKSGIPDVLTMDFNLYDTDGVASNIYSVDISDESETDTDSEESSTSKTSKTAKKKTTKKKTTKKKTTKAKTTKTKKTKSTADEGYGIDKTSQNISLAKKEIAVSDDRSSIIIACTVAVVICTAAACAVSIINSRKGKDNNRQG